MLRLLKNIYAETPKKTTVAESKQSERIILVGKDPLLPAKAPRFFAETASQEYFYSDDEQWIVFYNNKTNLEPCEWHGHKGHIEGYVPHKLHISVNFNFFRLTFSSLISILENATRNHAIHGFKVINVIKNQSHSERYLNLPYTVYLHPRYDSANAVQVLSVCKEIEEALKNVPPGYVQHYDQNDIVLSPHLTFRQSARNGVKEYISSDDPLASILVTEGKNSEWYQFLHAGLSPGLEEKNNASVRKLSC